MLTVIHGSDTVSSRNFFLEQKKNASNPITLSAEAFTITDLIQILEGGELFTEVKYIFIEQLFTKKKKGKERDAIIAALQAHVSEHNIILLEDKELDKTSLSQLRNAIIRAFNLPQALFTFLDDIKPNNSKVLLTFFHQTLATVDPEMIFFMLVRQFRLLLALHPSSSYPSRIEKHNTPQDKGYQGEVIAELKRLAPWQRSKLERQATLFSVEKLKKNYNNLFSIELAQKTGVLTGDVASAIDFLLLEI